MVPWQRRDGEAIGKREAQRLYFDTTTPVATIAKMMHLTPQGFQSNRRRWGWTARPARARGVTPDRKTHPRLRDVVRELRALLAQLVADAKAETTAPAERERLARTLAQIARAAASAERLDRTHPWDDEEACDAPDPALAAARDAAELRLELARRVELLVERRLAECLAERAAQPLVDADPGRGHGGPPPDPLP